MMALVAESQGGSGRASLDSQERREKKRKKDRRGGEGRRAEKRGNVFFLVSFPLFIKSPVFSYRNSTP